MKSEDAEALETDSLSPNVHQTKSLEVFADVINDRRITTTCRQRHG